MTHPDHSNGGSPARDGAHPADPPSRGSDHPQRGRSENSGHSQTLACGADADELFEQVAEGGAAQLSEHQRGCVHCQAALREFAALWAPVSTAVAAPVAVPDGFADSVMAQVRRLARDVWYTLELSDGGSLRIAARVVATIARDAARSVAGVRVALGRSTQGKAARLVEKATLGHLHPNAAVGVLGRTAVVDIALATSYGPPVHEVARHVQERVIAELRDKVGLKTIQVNVTVDDVLDPGEGSSEEQAE